MLKRGRGRPPGSPNKAPRERAERIAEDGQTPLDYMIAVMRDITQPAERRDDMAKAAAPYVHSRLSSAEVKKETTVRYVAEVPPVMPNGEEWEKRYAPPTLQ